MTGPKVPSGAVECLSSRDTPPICHQSARYAVRDLDLVDDLGVEAAPFWPDCDDHAAVARAEGVWHMRTLQPHEVDTARASDRSGGTS